MASKAKDIEMIVAAILTIGQMGTPSTNMEGVVEKYEECPAELMKRGGKSGKTSKRGK